MNAEHDMIKLVIFDLDDVLFPERSYIQSGFHAVAKMLTNDPVEQEKLFSKMLYLFNEDKKKVFDNLASEFNDLDHSQKSKLINEMILAYRNHMPSIEPYDDTVPVLDDLKNKGFKIAILSDGRGNGQELKTEALGIKNRLDKIIFTDMLGPNKKFWKPNIHAFQILLDHFKINPSEACYVGDNVIKDFQGPEKIGMHYVLLSRQDGLYQGSEIQNINNDVLVPKFKIKSLYELKNVLEQF